MVKVTGVAHCNGASYQGTFASATKVEETAAGLASTDIYYGVTKSSGVVILPAAATHFDNVEKVEGLDEAVAAIG